jgi:signal transduction histidine kinase
MVKQWRYQMKKILLAGFVSLFLFGLMAAVVNAAGTEAEAKAMVEKAIAYYKANGKDKAFAEVSNNKGQFVKEDLYVTVYDMNGKCLAHGANKSMIGLDLIGFKDSDGKLYIKERVELAKAKGKGWQEFKFTNPLTKKIEPKTAYFEKVDDYIFMCGAYKK